MIIRLRKMCLRQKRRIKSRIWYNGWDHEETTEDNWDLEKGERVFEIKRCKYYDNEEDGGRIKEKHHGYEDAKEEQWKQGKHDEQKKGRGDRWGKKRRR